MISADSIPATALYLAKAHIPDSNPLFKTRMVSDVDQGENVWPYPLDGECILFKDHNF